MAVLEIENLSAFYGKAQALSNVSLSVGEGELTSLLSIPKVLPVCRDIIDISFSQYQGIKK